MVAKLESDEVNRILDNLLEQGNGEEISFWVWDHMCGHCDYKVRMVELRKEFRNVGCLDGSFVDEVKKE